MGKLTGAGEQAPRTLASAHTKRPAGHRLACRWPVAAIWPVVPASRYRRAVKRDPGAVCFAKRTIRRIASPAPTITNPLARRLIRWPTPAKSVARRDLIARLIPARSPSGLVAPLVW